MNNNQTIYCSVQTCKFNKNKQLCALNHIKVQPTLGCDTKCPDESMCASYENLGK